MFGRIEDVDKVTRMNALDLSGVWKLGWSDGQRERRRGRSRPQ
jgi:hypothetical protein